MIDTQDVMSNVKSGQLELDDRQSFEATATLIKRSSEVMTIF